MGEEEAQTAEKKQLFRCHPPLFNRPHPWLVISHGYNLQRQTFYNLSEGRYYTKIIPELEHRNITHSIGNTGWLHLEDCLSDDYCLLNIVSMEKKQLPTLPENTKIVNLKCIVSSAPTDPDCRVVFYESFDDVIVSKPGDESCIKLELDHGALGSFVSATMFEGKIYGLIMPGCELLVADDTTEPEYFTQVPLELAPELLVQDSTSYLVESCGELLLVNRCWRSGFCNEVLRFQVFVADFAKTRWVRLKNIGERAIFLDRYQCFSCSTAELGGGGGVKGNSIYFTYSEDRNIYVYDLEDRSISILLPCPIVSSRYSVLKWIMMPGTDTIKL